MWLKRHYTRLDFYQKDTLRPDLHKKRIAIAQLLIAKGIDPEIKDIFGITPLFTLISYGYKGNNYFIFHNPTTYSIDGCRNAKPL